MDDLALRSRTQTLPAASVAGVAGAPVEILNAQPKCNPRSTWRILELWSNEGRSWEATVSWSGGSAGPRSAQLTVARSTRVCVFASSVSVQGAGLSLSPIHAWASVADGQIPTENQWVVRGVTAQDVLTKSVTVPPFARFVRLELADATLLDTSFLALQDGFGVTRAHHRASQQPHPGAPVGDAETVALSFPNEGLAWRVTFLLQL